MKIKSPVKDFTGTQTYGDTVLTFKDGVAEHDGELKPSIRHYLHGAGYKVGGKAGADVDDAPVPADPREVTHVQGGTPLRDAAVDPRKDDFLAPTNAGKSGEAGNPHGPNVIAPGIHGNQGIRPVKAGEVHVDKPAAQDKAETAHAKASVDGDTVPGSEPAAELKGAALDEALEAAGLPKTGTADEKRARLAEHTA